MLRFIIPLVVAAAAITVAACAADGGKEITRSRYGSDWPLTVASATLHCANDAVWVERPGGSAKYPLNGIAEMRLSDTRPLEQIWRYDPKLGAPYRVNIGQLIRDGLALCDD